MKIKQDGVRQEKLRNVLFLLVRLGLWGDREEHNTRLNLTEEDWNDVFRLAMQHTVTGLAFQGVSHLPDSQIPPQSLLVRWMAETDAVERRNKKMNGVLGQLYNIFHEKGLNPILQKGQGVANYYESPLLRVCGDIDLYFNNKKAWDDALDFLRKNNITFTKQADEGISYRWQGVDIEHHSRLFDLYNPFLQGFVGKLEGQKGYRHTALSTYPSVIVTTPSPFLDILLQSLHILKHSVSRGIGLRQMCDMARSCYKLHGEIDSEEMKAVCNKIGLHRWCPLLHTFLIDYLGLPKDCLPYEDTVPSAVPLAEIVWRGGNFGQYDSMLVSESVAYRRKLNTIRSFIRNMHFASYYAPKETFWYFVQLLKGQFK